MDQRHQSPWRPPRGQLLSTVAALALLTIAILIGYRYHITLWDWIKLLVVPVVIAGGGIWFNRQQRERELKIGDQRAEEDRRIAQERTKTDREIADQRAQDEALQAYLDQIGQLLLDKVMPLRQSNEGDEVRTLARARTLTVLRRLDSENKGRVLQFLHESALIMEDRVVDLSGADLSGILLGYADLSHADLSHTDLSNAKLRSAKLSEANLKKAYLFYADLHGADLSHADLSEAYLRDVNLGEDVQDQPSTHGAVAEVKEANLRGANLSDADLSGANLRWADLNGANLREVNLYSAKLFEANLSDADLSGADLSGATPYSAPWVTPADLSGADLSGANLSDAYVTEEQLTTCKSLEGATMPNGQKYEDWIKDTEGRKEDGKDE